MKKTKNVKVAVDSFLTIRQTRGISSYISRLSVLIKKNTDKNIADDNFQSFKGYMKCLA